MRRVFHSAVPKSGRRYFSAVESGLVLVRKDEINESIAIVTLNNGDKLNALTEDMGNTLRRIVGELTESKTLRAVVLTGAGRAFSAGGDMSFLKSRIEAGSPKTEESLKANEEVMIDFYDKFLSVKRLHVPIIAAVNGPAVGAGLCLAMACDIRYVSQSAAMSVNFSRLGIHPGMGSSYHLPQIVGTQQAARLMLTGCVIKGDEAQRMGLALESLPTEEVLPAALKLAREITVSAALPVNQTVATLRKGVTSLDNSLRNEAIAQAEDFGIGGEDVSKGLDAVMNKSKRA